MFPLGHRAPLICDRGPLGVLLLLRRAHRVPPGVRPGRHPRGADDRGADTTAAHDQDATVGTGDRRSAARDGRARAAGRVQEAAKS